MMVTGYFLMLNCAINIWNFYFLQLFGFDFYRIYFSTSIKISLRQQWNPQWKWAALLCYLFSMPLAFVGSNWIESDSCSVWCSMVARCAYGAKGDRLTLINERFF